MGKIAFVFSGQGAQYSGMGKELYDMGAAMKKLYDEAESFRPGTMDMSFNGSPDDLKITSNTQPCLYLVDLASALALNENGIYADGCAGFSLGEIAALAYAGAYTYSDGFKIVTARGKLMQSAAEKYDTAMCAVLKKDAETVKKAVSEFEDLYAVNFNSPGQTVVSGLKKSVDEFSAKMKADGARCVPLAVSAAFHSPFMNDASASFAEELKKYDIKKPDIDVYANLNASPYGDNVTETLAMQMKSPVEWQKTIENMIADGYTEFIEVGAGKTLSGLIKKISGEVKIYSVQDKESLEKTVEAVKNND